MQRKALKQLGKVTQWTNEKTQLSNEFQQFEKEVEVNRLGIERLHATSMPFFENITKVKQTADPESKGKDKILTTEALGLVMIDYGGELKGSHGDALAKYGRTRCKLAIAQEEFGSRLRENYIAGMERSLDAVNEYKTFRKKLESRRLALDAAIAKLNHAKKEKDQRILEQEVEIARERFDEVEEETAARMEVIQGEQEQQFVELTDLLEAELEYFTKCKELMDELRDSWPSGSTTTSSGNRPRAKSNASRTSARNKSRPSAPATSEDDDTPNRPRSHSNASTGKTKRSILPSFGSFGRKSGLNVSTKPKKEKRERYDDEGRAALHSDSGMSDDEPPQLSPRAQFAASGRTKSSSTIQSSNQLISNEPSFASATPPPLRRTYTSPGDLNARYVKALYAFAGDQPDELALRPGMIIQVKNEVSEDWWLGESSGKTGIFPTAYCEEYVPSPTTATQAVPKRSLPPSLGINTRTLAPPMHASRSNPPSSLSRASTLPPSPVLEYQMTSDSEMSQGYDDADHYATASLAAAATPPSPAYDRSSSRLASAANSRPPSAAANRSRSSTITKKPPPPPPPPISRRTQSTTNIFTSSPSSSTSLQPPMLPTAATRARSNTGSAVRNFNLESSPEGSPFVGSEEEDGEVSSNGGRSGDQGITMSPKRAGGTGVGGVVQGIAGLQLPKQTLNGDSEGAGDCAECGCEDFTQNVFKPKGICSTCYHQH